LWSGICCQTTTTRFCGHKCASREYKQRKREEKVQTTLSDQIKSGTSANSENLQSLQSLPIKTGNFINLRDKEFLSVQETAILLGASRWTIQRMIQREELKAGKLGRRTIIPRSEIDNLFN
jgi:excisionase family DNA binding protein